MVLYSDFQWQMWSSLKPDLCNSGAIVSAFVSFEWLSPAPYGMGTQLTTLSKDLFYPREKKKIHKPKNLLS